VNRWSKQIDLDLRQVERFLGEPVIGFVPSDYQTAVTSINLGTPLVRSEPNSKIAQELMRIAGTIRSDAVLVRDDPKPRRNIWNSLFKRDSSQTQLELQTTGTDFSL
jgi:MinD-like ATPase involved in chromosome partitioning or flagellar assembly